MRLILTTLAFAASSPALAQDPALQRTLEWDAAATKTEAAHDSERDDELVVGDQRMQMVWIEVDRDEEDSAAAAVREAYGQSAPERDMFLAFEPTQTAWRAAPPAYLLYSPELADAASDWFASVG